MTAPGADPTAGATAPRRAAMPCPGRARRAWLAVVGTLVVLGMLLDPLVRLASDHMISDATGGCAHLQGVSVDYGPWPTAARALSGQLTGLTARADEVVIGRLEASSVRATIARVTYSPWALLSGGGGVTIHDGRLSAVIVPSTIQTYLNDNGISGTIEWTPGSPALHIDLLGFRFPLFLQATDGGISLSPLPPIVTRLLPLRLVV